MLGCHHAQPISLGWDLGWERALWLHCSKGLALSRGLVAVLMSDVQQKAGKREGKDKPRTVLPSPVGRTTPLSLF